MLKIILKEIVSHNHFILLNFLEFQYKVLHLLTEIRDEMEGIKKILKSKNSLLNVVQIDTLKEFIKFDESLSDKEAEKNIVRNITLHVYQNA